MDPDNASISGYVLSTNSSEVTYYGLTSMEGTLDNFSIKICYEQIEKNHKKFDGCGNQQSWDEGFESAYNYKLSKKKKISLRKEGF